MNRIMLNLGSIVLSISVGIACSMSKGYGVVQESINLMKKEYGVYNRNEDVLQTLSAGDTILVLSRGYGKDYVYLKVKVDGTIGYVYGHDPIEFHLKDEDK